MQVTMQLKTPTLELWEIDRLTPYELNAKTHDKAQVERIAQSVREFGWDQPIVVDKNGVIIKGHGRRLAAISLNLAKVPVLIRDDLTEDQVRAARLADNRVAISDLNVDILQQELATLNFDLEGIFDSKELDFVTADLSEMNFDAVVTDLEEAVAGQSEETLDRIKKADDRAVRIEKALGFKEVEGRDERVIVRFMALAEATTGLEGAPAFVAYISQLSKGVA